MYREEETMLRLARIEYVVGIIAIIWAVLMAAVKQPLADQLSVMAPANVWIVAAFGIGSAQIIIARHPKLFIHSALHWLVAFGGAIFWCYVATTVQTYSLSPIAIVIYWACAVASLWDLGHA